MEDCLDASFRVFLEDLYLSLYAASAAFGVSTTVAGAAPSEWRMGKGGEKDEGQETGQDSRPEVRAYFLCLWSI